MNRPHPGQPGFTRLGLASRRVHPPADFVPRFPSRRRSCLYRLIALMVGLIFACGLLEIGARIIFAAQIRAFQQNVANDPHDVYNLFEPDAELGWKHRPGAEIVADDLPDQPPFTVRINAQGLYDLDYTYERPAGGFRVLVLGDSYVEAVQVPLPARSFQGLEDRYQARWGSVPYEIVEMGVARYSPAQYYRVYQLEGQRYAPDVVIAVIYLGNDVEEMHPATGHQVVVGLAERPYQYTLEDGQLVALEASQWHPPSGSSRVSARLPLGRWLHLWLYRHSVLYYLLIEEQIDTPAARALGITGGDIPLAARFQVSYQDPIYAQVWPVFEAVIVALGDAAVTNGSEFAVVLAPEMYAVHEDWYFADYPEAASRRDRFDPYKIERQVSAMLDAHGIPYFSLTPYLRAAAQASDEALYYHDNTHWTPAGHRVVGEALDGWFNQMGWAAAQP